MLKNEQTQSSMTSKFTYSFYDNNNELIMTDTLNIVFAFNEKNTIVGGEKPIASVKMSAVVKK